MKVKKIIIFMIMAIFIFVGGESENVKAAEICNVSFLVKDNTDNGYSGNIKVIMTDTNSDKKFEYVLTRGNSWGGSNIPKYSIDGDTTYNVALSGMKSGFKMVNQDGSEIKQFNANADIELKWKIISVSSENITVKEDSENTNSNIAISEQIQTGNEEADKMFNEFMQTIQFIKTDDNWKNFLESYELYADSGAVSNSEEYVKATGGKKEDYMKLSSFDKFVYYETYIRMAQYLSFGNWERYYGSKENFDRNVIGTTVNYMKITEVDSTVVADAYKKLMDWQYEYIYKNNAPYDFIAGKDFIQTKNENNGSQNSIEQTENKTDGNKENETKSGIWDGSVSVIRENLFSIIIAVILAGGIGILILYRKKRNLHDDGVN